MSAMIRIRNAKGEFVRARALLDTCATAHFVTADFARKLGLPMHACSVLIGAINELSTLSENSIDICFRSIHSEFQKTLTFLTVPRITDAVPDETFPQEMIRIPPNLKLADPDFHIPRPIDMLLGSGATLSLLSVGQINLSREGCDLILQKTQLGWVVVGGIDESREVKAYCNLAELTDQLARFWEVEDVTGDSPNQDERQLCEDHYKKTTVRNPDGRYMVRLPFRGGTPPDLGESRSIALRRFRALERRFARNPDLKREYSKAMQEYIDLRFMSLIPNEDSPGYYLPHREVVKHSSSTTKLRVVFDASAKTTAGVSLNGELMIGPVIQDKLFIQLLRFRMYKYGLIADVEKMYPQVAVHPEDRRFLRVFWYQGEALRIYEFNVVVFGLSPSSFLATRTFQQLAEDEGADFPDAAEIVARNFYVDDLLTGADSLDKIMRICDSLIALLKRGKFNIRQWASNHNFALNNLDHKEINAVYVSNGEPAIKTLGVVWNTRDDTFTYSVTPVEVPVAVSKHAILSEIAKIFDPLGLLGPIILLAKVIMQECWRARVDWDESVPQELYSRWLKFTQQLPLIRKISINRRLFVEIPARGEIHGFCDASRVGYGACLYVRSTSESNSTVVRLMCAKSRVTPLKELSIPRLELCGALTLARLYSETRAACTVAPERVILWSDSTTVLNWIKKSPQALLAFESNRVREIQSLGQEVSWRYVNTKSNPADALSKGQFPAQFINNESWFHGPAWLQGAEETWPAEARVTSVDLPGLKKSSCLLVSSNDDRILCRFSFYSTLVKVVAFCLRWRPSNVYTTKQIGVQEKVAAERIIVKLIQSNQFGNCINRLTDGKRVKEAKLAAFNPFLDEHGILRVGGRLKGANIPFSQKHPILLPSRHHVTNLLSEKSTNEITTRAFKLHCLRCDSVSGY